jgi:hypothetical protein
VATQLVLKIREVSIAGDREPEESNVRNMGQREGAKPWQEFGFHFYWNESSWNISSTLRSLWRMNFRW